MGNVSGLGLATLGMTGSAGTAVLSVSVRVLNVTVTGAYLDVQFDQVITLAPYGRNAAAWTITAGLGAYPVSVTNASEVSADTIRLTTTEMTDGGSYVLNLVVGLVQNPTHQATNEEQDVPFVGAGSPPQVVSVVAHSAKTVVVTFDRAMNLDDLANHTKFTIEGIHPSSDPLTILSASPESNLSTLLTTEPMQPNAVNILDDYYTFTTTARSAAGNHA